MQSHMNTSHNNSNERSFKLCFYSTDFFLEFSFKKKGVRHCSRRYTNKLIKINILLEGGVYRRDGQGVRGCS